MIVSNRTAFWDGDNFVIVSKHCSKEQAVRLLQVLAAADLGEVEPAPESYAEPVEEPEEVMPAIPEDDESAAYDVYSEGSGYENTPEEPAEPDPFRFEGGPFKGLTPSEVMEQAEDKDKAFGNLGWYCQRWQGQYEEGASAIRAVLEDSFRQRYGKIKDPYKTVARLDEKKCDKFLKFYSSIMTDSETARLLEQSGSIDFASFLKEATLEQKRSLIAAIIEVHGYTQNR